MSSDLTYNINDVVTKLSTKISKLEVLLAHEQSAKAAYMDCVKKLEKQHEKEDAE